MLKDYGIPQNRERVFIVSIRKDIDNGKFEFPKPFELQLRLKDMLEDEVDEKYFLSDKMIEYIVANNEKWTGNNNKSLINKSIASTINTCEGTRRCDASNYVSKDIPEDCDLKNKADILVEHLIKTNQIKELPCCCDSTINEPKVREISNCITARYNAGIQNQKQIGLCVIESICIKEATKKGYAEASEGDGVYLNRPHQKRGVVQKGMIQTIKCNGNDLGVVVKKIKLRIRKLTPKECFRLMGFEDDVIDTLTRNGISNTQLYKQAGNSIVVDVLEEIFVSLFNALHYTSNGV